MADVFQKVVPTDQWIYDDDTGDLVGVRGRTMNGADLRVDRLTTGQKAAMAALDTATPTASDTVLGLQSGAVKRFSVGDIVPFVSVKWFGAVGDGVTDDAAAIQAAFTAADSSGCVFFPTGTYKTSAAITANCSFYGVGSGSEIRPTGDFEAFDVQIAHADVRNLGFVRDLVISYEYATGASTAAAGMWLNKSGAAAATSGTNNVKFSGLYFINCYRAIQQKVTDHGNLWNVKFENILVLAPVEHGIYLDLTADNGSLNVSFDNVTIDFGSNTTTAKGAYINGVSNLRFHGTSTSKLGTDASCFHVLNSTNVDVRLQIESANCTTSGARLVFFQNCSSVELSLNAASCTFNHGGGNLAHYAYFDANCERIVWRAFDNPGEVITSGTVYHLNIAEAASTAPKLMVLDPALTKAKVYAHADVFKPMLWPENVTTGTFSPTLVAEAGALGAITYNALHGGQYIRVGNLVHIQGIVYTDAVALGTGAGEVRIGGLPFTAAASTGGTQDGFCAISVAASSDWTTHQPIGAFIRAGSTLMNLTYRAAADGASANMEVGHITTVGTGNLLRFAGTYIAA